MNDTPKTDAKAELILAELGHSFAAMREFSRDLERKLIESTRCQDILASAMAEIKASHEGTSDQPIAEIIEGCIAEIRSTKTVSSIKKRT